MKERKFLKKAMCLGLTAAMLIGVTSPVTAAHQHETAADIVTEIMNETIGAAETVIDKQSLLDAADVTDTKNSLAEADDKLAETMANLEAAVENAENQIDELDGKVTKDDAKEINATLSEAYKEASAAHADAVKVTEEALVNLETANEAYEAAKQISEDAAEVADAELKAAQKALNAAVEATKFANDNMTNLKNEFAKATELASKWNAEAEEALTVAMENLAAANEALNNALAAIETGDAELKAAIDEFKRCYDALVVAAEAFKVSIEKAIAAQEYLEALYAEYEAAKAALVAAQAAYESTCTEYEAAGLPNTYEAYKTELDARETAKNTAIAELEAVEAKIAILENTLETYINDPLYIALEGYKAVLTNEEATAEKKAEAAKNAAELVIKQTLANGYTVKEVAADGEGKYGKADKEYFVVLNGETLIARYGYVCDEATGVVSIYEMTYDGITNYIVYNNEKYELLKEEDNYYIEVAGKQIPLTNIGSDYYETLTAAGRKVEDETQFTSTINAASLINVFGKDLGDYIKGNVTFAPTENVNAEDGTGEYVYEINLIFKKLTYVISIERDARTGVYSHRYYYTAECEAKECENPNHTDETGHVERTSCTLEEHEKSKTHDKTYTIPCTNDKHSEGNHPQKCNNTDHINNGCGEFYGCTMNHEEHNYYTYKDYSVCKKTHKFLGKKIPCAGAVTECDYKEVTLIRASLADILTDCGAKANSACTYEDACNPLKVTQEDCNVIELGKCYKNLYTKLNGVFPETIPQAEYGNEWHYILSGKDENGNDYLYIQLTPETELKVNATDDGKYTYLSKVEFESGMDADKFYTYGTDVKADSEYYAAKIQQVADAIAAEELIKKEKELAKTNAETEFNTWSENFTALKEAHEALQSAEAVAAEKELGELADLPKNIEEMVEGLEPEEMLALLEAIVELSSQSDNVDYKEILNVLAEIVDAKAAARLIWVLGYDVVDDGIDSILPFGLFDDIAGSLEGVVGGLIDKLTPPTEFERTYANAWVDALTTKIKVVQNAIKLVEAATATVEAGVTAVTEGIELADVAVEAVLATAEKEILEATVDVLAMATDILGTSEEVVTTIDNVIAEAQAKTEAAYLTAVTERNALNQVTFAKPYATELENALVTIGTVAALQNDLAADIKLAEAPLADAKALYEELKVVEEHTHNYEADTTEATCTEDGCVVYTCTICTDTYTEILEATGHAYESIVIDPSCTEGGYTTYTCTVCNDSYVADETEATGHSYESVVTEPGCLDGGHTTHTCKVCGNIKIDEEIGATGHDYVTVTEEATCEKAGSVTTTCSRCDYEAIETIDALGHDYVTVTEEAACETAGSVTTTCSRCDYEAIETIDAFGHDYVTVTEEATCETAGSVTTTCSRCDYEAVETMDAFGHDYVTVTVEASCTTAGSVTTTCNNCDYKAVKTINALGHDYATVTVEATCTGAGSVTDTCTVCGNTVVETIDALGHNYGMEVTAPTCIAAGYTTHTCTNCTDSYVTDEIPALGHDYTHSTEVTAPTCTTAGYTTRTCKCGNTITDTVVEAIGHAFGDWIVTKEATEDNFGEQIRYCTVAGCDGKEVEAIEKLQHTHNYGVGVVTEPTCTAGGYTTYTCAKCGDVKVENKVALLGHNYVATETAPTCTAPGYFTYVCSRCGDTYTAESGKAATGHSFGDWVIIKESTETETGLATRTCHCGATETQDVAKKDHAYTAVVTAPTCITEGYTTYTCECGDSYVADRVPALGHKENAVVTEATCTAGGYTTYTCMVCGNSRTADATNVLGHAYVPVVTTPTCTAEGYTTYTCSRCNDSYTADATTALGHAYGDWTVTKEATEEAEGEQARICATCGKKDTQTIAKKEHVHVYTISVITEATCIEEGYTTHTCKCGESVVDTYVDALGHAWTEWTTVKEATKEEAGQRARECERCNATETESVEFIPTLVTSITLNRTEISMKKGATLQIIATVLPEDATDATVTWSTSDETIATVSEDGVVKAVKVGEVEITATANDGSDVSATCVITVKNPIVIIPDAPEEEAPEAENETPVEEEISEVQNEEVAVEESIVEENEEITEEIVEENEDTVEIEDEETPLVSGDDEVVEIEDEETPLASGTNGTGNGGNTGLIAAAAGIGVVGTGAAVVATQAGIFGATGAAAAAGTAAGAASGAAANAAANVAGAAATEAGKKTFGKSILAIFKKLFKK